MTPRYVCVDASFAVDLIDPRTAATAHATLWQQWVNSRTIRVGPPLFFAEVTSVLRNHVAFGRLTPSEGEQAFADFLRLRVRQVDPADLQPRAWALAKQYNRPRAYDAQYLAVAQSYGCDLWTGDRRLANAVQVPWVRLA